MAVMTIWTRDEFRENLRAMAAPINVEALVEQGVLKPVRGRCSWYVLLKPPDLPHHASVQVTELRSCPRGGPLQIRVQSPAAMARARALCDRWEGAPP